MLRTKRSRTQSAANSNSKPPEQVTFFLDESLDSLTVVEALRDAGAVVERLTDHFPKGIPDEVWLAEAGRKGWIVLTRDKRIRYRQLERLALRAARVRAFVFTGGNVSGTDTGAILTGALKRIEKILAANPGPFIYHIGRAGRPMRMD